MATIEWDQLSLNIDWAKALERLLTDAREAISENNSGKRISCQRQLREFIKRSPARCGTLDDIASNAIDDLFNNQLEASIAAIDRRQSELQGAISLIESVTAELNKDDRSIRFTKTIEILNQASSSIDILVQMEKQMTEPNQELILRVDAVNKSIQALFALAGELNPD